MLKLVKINILWLWFITASAHACIVGNSFSDVVAAPITVPVSAVLTGATFAAETTFVVGGSVGGAALVCSPIMILEGTSSGRISATSNCFNFVFNSIWPENYFDSTLASGVWRATEVLRCSSRS